MKQLCRRRIIVSGSAVAAIVFILALESLLDVRQAAQDGCGWVVGINPWTYDEIRPRMTLADVEHVVGLSPGYHGSWGIRCEAGFLTPDVRNYGKDARSYNWRTDDGGIVVILDANGRVVTKKAWFMPGVRNNALSLLSGLVHLSRGWRTFDTRLCRNAVAAE